MVRNVSGRPPREAGQASMAAVAVLGVVIAFAWGLARLGSVVAADAAAQAAADAVALAGALEGRVAADEVAAANGAELVAWYEEGWLVQVVVARAGQRARATAEWYEGPPTAVPGRDRAPP